MSTPALSKLTESLQSYCSSPPPQNPTLKLSQTLSKYDASIATFENIYNAILPFLNDLSSSSTESVAQRLNAYNIMHYIIAQQVALSNPESASQIHSALLKWLQERIVNDLDLAGALFRILKEMVEKWASDVSDYSLRLVLQSTFENIPIQSLAIAPRRQFFDLLIFIIENRPMVCQVEFVVGYIQAIDGERDPLILNNSFRIFPTLAKISPRPVDSHAEELFDIFSCYFPVSFNPPKKDPHGITREGLASNLLKTLGARPSFAAFALPFFEEKISSAIVETKVEALNAAAYCIEQFGEEDAREHLVELWASIRTEILRSTQKEVHHASIDAITRIARVVSAETVGRDQSQVNVERVLQPAVQEIRSPECRMARQFSEMIAAVAASSEWNCDLTTHTIIPQIYQLFLEVKTTPKRSGILVIGMQILSTLLFYPNLKEASNMAVERMWEIAFSLRDDYNLKMEIIDIMSRLALFERMADTDEPAKYLVLALTSGDDAECERVLKCIDWMFNNANKEDVVRDEILASLLSSMSDETAAQETSQRVVSVVCRIGLLCPSLVPKCVDDLFAKAADDLKQGRISQSTSTTLDALFQLVKSEEIEKSTNTDYIQRTAQIICNHPQVLQQQSLQKISNICRELYSQLDVHTQQKVAQTLLDALQGKREALAAIGVSNTTAFDSFATNETFLFFVSKVLLFMKQETLQSGELQTDFSDLTRKLLDYVVKAEKGELSISITHFLASVLNKAPLDHLHDVSSSVVEPQIDTLLDTSVNQRNIEVMSWLQKAFIMRPDSSFICGRINSKFQALLVSSDASIAFAAARGYGIVMQDQVLTKENFSNSTVFFRQKFFMMNIGNLLETYKTLEESSRGPLLEAVANLIQNLPTSVLIGQIQQLYPLVYAALASTNLDVIQSGLNTMRILIDEADDYCQDRLGEIIPRLIQLSTKRDRMKIRCDALKCLQELVEYEFSKVYPHQEEVIRGLRGALDDHKRVVRREAVIARNRWFTINQ
eukprot:CAMPEP_0117436620 /NCGR_PEP_ID=MMETSP0759-20121206/1101_1 /TAXON_ID=63605 /ORGANISM="Percolomonas cosmopolitus, Strain WS" /LENGTH=1002 /DNA_ID=CAMNT_0005228225 /DNA_START=22 /DNA_END=3030 /DNA_ORIENTATION=-